MQQVAQAPCGSEVLFLTLVDRFYMNIDDFQKILIDTKKRHQQNSF